MSNKNVVHISEWREEWNYTLISVSVESYYYYQRNALVEHYGFHQVGSMSIRLSSPMFPVSIESVLPGSSVESIRDMV